MYRNAVHSNGGTKLWIISAVPSTTTEPMRATHAILHTNAVIAMSCNTSVVANDQGLCGLTKNGNMS
jgi:hypothetical protein